MVMTFVENKQSAVRDVKKALHNQSHLLILSYRCFPYRCHSGVGLAGIQKY